MLPSYIRIQDIADILIMTFLLHQLYSWFRNTRAMQVLFGLGVVTLIYFVTRFFDLYMTSWILQELGTVLIILIIVVFQAEIRQALYRFSHVRSLYGQQEREFLSHFHQIAETLFRLGERRTGALLVFGRSDNLADFMLNGVRLDSEISPQIIETIFAVSTPLHDGALLIRDDRIVQASCHLPLSSSPDIPHQFGTRHRAALGLAERSDAVVVVVSEERGEVTLVESGSYRQMKNPEELAAALGELVRSAAEKPRLTVRRALLTNLLPKAALLAVVTVFWALITSRQGQTVTATVPVRLQGVPDELVLVRSQPDEVEVQVKSLSRLAPAPDKLDLTAAVDASRLREGQTSIRVRHSDFSLPSGVEIVAVNPAAIKVVAEKKLRKRVPVRVQLKGALAGPPGRYEAVADPPAVEVEGPASLVARVDAVTTEEIDARRLSRETAYRKNLLPPGKKIALLSDEPVVIRVVPAGRK